MKRNSNLERLKSNYLFPEIASRKERFLSQHPGISLISLGIGDTTEPVPESIKEALIKISSQLGTREGYLGYGPEQGMEKLRKKISSELYSGFVDPDEIFISDGAKCDISRLQLLFGNKVSIAIQDPTYPVYLEGSLIQGVEKIVSMPCSPENDFFPKLNEIPKTDLIYFCSPNNPTGAAASRSQLEELVAFARSNRSIIIFDSAYASYIQSASIPRSIFEIDGAKEVAIEVSSFSKLAGFTGIRLGWTVVPKELKYEDGSLVRKDWLRLISTVFNGASNISQHGGVAVLDEKGLKEISAVTKFYLENARLIKEAMLKSGYEVYGGTNAPYLWVRFKGKKSWEIFQHFLESFHLVTTPGSGFGVEGEGFIRISAFGRREIVLEAIERIKS